MPFEKLLIMSNKDVQSWLIKIDANKEIKTLVTALLTADEKAKLRIFTNMSTAAAAALKADVAARQAENPGAEEISAAVSSLERLF